MANLSDAFGTITVDKVGKEFLEYARIASKNYYDLVNEDCLNISPAENLTIEFFSFGRWSFNANLEGYLDPAGTWHETAEESEAYKKLYDAILKTGGSIIYKYTDSDISMDWMGTGWARLELVDGNVSYADEFNEQNVTVKGFVELYKLDEREVVERLYGDGAVGAYDDYKAETNDPLPIGEWYDKKILRGRK